MSDLDDYRKKIDEIDQKMTELFEERMNVVMKVGEYKKANNLPVLNKSREGEVLKKNIGYLENKEYADELKAFFINMMNIAKDLEHKKMKEKSNIDKIFSKHNIYKHKK